MKRQSAGIISNYQIIDLEHYIRSGEGGTAVSYVHKTRNALAKLYNPGFGPRAGNQR